MTLEAVPAALPPIVSPRPPGPSATKIRCGFQWPQQPQPPLATPSLIMPMTAAPELPIATMATRPRPPKQQPAFHERAAARPVAHHRVVVVPDDETAAGRRGARRRRDEADDARRAVLRHPAMRSAMRKIGDVACDLSPRVEPLMRALENGWGGSRLDKNAIHGVLARGPGGLLRRRRLLGRRHGRLLGRDGARLVGLRGGLARDGGGLGLGCLRRLPRRLRRGGR